MILLLAAAPARPETSGRLPDAVEIDLILRQLADITGFRIHRQLPFQMVNREQVNAFLKQQIRESVKPQAIRAEEVTLKKFGFVPPEFDLRQTTIDLLTEQAAAFYDFRRKKLFISDWASRNMRDQALVHELAHALADQNFPIRKYLGDVRDDSEAALARESVVEGQASWLMIEWAARRMGRTLADPNTSQDLLQTQMDSADPAYPVFSKAPLYLRATLMFPYESGERFQHSLFAMKGQASFAEVFRRPPSSTAQILHPERYASSEVPVSPDLPKPVHGARSFVKGAMGELDHRILLRQFVDREVAEELPPLLKGAAFRIDEARSGGRMTLIYKSVWQDEASARRFFEAYRQILERKWKSLEVARENDSAFGGRGDDGYFEVRRNGASVISREGFERPFALN